MIKKYLGQRVYEGYALGSLVVYQKEEETFSKIGKGFDLEFQRFTDARTETLSYLDRLYLDTFSRLGEKEAQLFQTYKLMADDLDFEDLIKVNLQSEQSAEYAVKNAGLALSDMFSSMDDNYLKERAKDVIYVADYIISFLTKKKKETLLEKPSIVICDDLPASELMKFNKDFLIGLICLKGSSSSHVSILSRMLELPSVANVDNLELSDIDENTFCIIDGCKGEILLNPNSDEISKYYLLQEEFLNNKIQLQKLIGKEAITLDGRKTKIYANIGSSYEVENVLKNDAEGVGLFRSEFLYLEAKDYPSEEEQFLHYKKVVEGLQGKEVIIRTLDIGADKKVDYFNLPPEENPALGYRSIRICKDRPEIFLTQLCALYRASHYGNLAIMVPMIISLEEIKYLKDMIGLTKDNLRKRNIPFNESMKVGIMIETPAAVLISDELAKEVDFFSIGSNDLSQYTLAVDRTNPKLKSTFDPHHKAILRLIEMTVRNAHKNNIIVGICGELARDPELVGFFMKLGVDELSVSPSYVLSLKNQIIQVDTTKIELEQYI